MNNPTVMFIRVSENCNAGCFMCNFAHTHGLYNITDEQFDNMINKMNEAGTYKMIRFTGGEPLLHPNIANFIKKSHDNGYLTSIITNGYLLPNLAEKLANAGLNQVIISVDGRKQEINDNLRGLKNGLERIKNGVAKLREFNPKIVIRANSVVSPLNIDNLNDLYGMLYNLKFDSWSIIPIRPTENPNTKWNVNDIDYYKEKYKTFIEEQKKYPELELLGYSSSWAGETEEEMNNTFNNKYRRIPRDKCNLVDYIRFYIPDKNLIIPCNCAAHRIHQIEAKYELEEDILTKAQIMAEWLKDNGPTHCSGCEPLNAYAADNTHILKKELSKFKY